MKEIPLTQGKVALVDDADHEWAMKWKWHAHRHRRKSGDIWYAQRSQGPRGYQLTISMHREIALRAGLPESGCYDHADTDGLNNQRFNLRPCTNAQNGANRKKTPGCSSRFKGVRWHLGKWEAYIQHAYLGRFATEESAAVAYAEAARKYFGEFANLDPCPA